MKNGVQIFTELGERLANFGECRLSEAVLEHACQANGWFVPCDVKRAVSALRNQMLQRHRLEAWLRHYAVPVKDPKRVLVVMAGNIPLVGFYDLLCVIVAGHHCVVKPAAKDVVLMEYVIGLLRDIEPQIAISYYDDREAIDAVIATGSDNANRYFRTHYAGIPSLLRGHRQSVAVLSGDQSAGQLQGLLDDVFAYSGLGCRSVSLVFMPRGYVWQPKVVDTNIKFRNNFLQNKALLNMTAVPYIDLGGAVMVESPTFPNSLSCIHYTYYDSLDEVRMWLSEHDNELQCVVCDLPIHSRCVAFGQAQCPTLADSPDERDVIDFLLNI